MHRYPLEAVAFFVVWCYPDLPVLHIHPNNTGPTARLTARRYHARISPMLCTKMNFKEKQKALNKPNQLIWPFLTFPELKENPRIPNTQILKRSDLN